MTKLTCTQCGNEVEKGAPVTQDDNLFVCKECWAKNNAKQIEKEKKINAKLAELVAQGKPYILEQVVKEVEAGMPA